MLVIGPARCVQERRGTTRAHVGRKTGGGCRLACDGHAQVLFPDGVGRLVGPNGGETDVPPERLCAAVRAPQPTNVPAITL